jgi:hypothetical protein
MSFLFSKSLIVSILLIFAVQLCQTKNSFCQEIIHNSNAPKILLQKISVNLQNVSFETFLDTFAQKTSIKLNYNRSRIPLNQQISIELKNRQAIEVLRTALELTSTELKYSSGNQFVLVPKITADELTGKIRGRILDSDNQQPLIAANILLNEYQMGAATNLDGNFLINNVPVGNYTLRISYIGYQTVLIPDVIVKSDRITFLNSELKETPIIGKQVIVRENYFSDINSEPVSSSNFSSEEIRRTATFAGDVGRIVSVLPSISNENEGNHLVVRGGSTIENKFNIDNIEVPNINHLPIMGTTGGFYSVANIDFIKNVDLYCGGFGSKYGNALSSVMQINLREGNREENDYQFDINIAGISAQGEGPLNNGEGSWMVSARHSFSDIVLMLQDEKEQSSHFNDIQGKVVYDISPTVKVSFLDIFSTDYFSETRNYSINNSLKWYGTLNNHQNIFGMNCKFLWNENSYSNATISHIYRKEKVDLFTTRTAAERIRLNTPENIIQFRNSNFYRINPAHKFELGVDLKLILSDINSYYASGLDLFGNFKPEMKINKSLSTLNIGGFLSYEWNPVQTLTLIPGARLDYYSFNQEFNISPRFAFSYYLNEKFFVTGSAGVYYQNLPRYFLYQSENFKELKNSSAYHIVLGLNYLISEDLKLSIELYNKQYKHLPVDPNLYSLYLLDEAINEIFYNNHENLVSKGVADSRGLELMLQKKLSDNFYGTFSISILNSRYRDLNGIWRNRIVDNDFLFAFEGGYKLDKEWEFSLRFNYSGGLLYTPFDRNKSTEMQTGIFDIDKVNSLRFPEFHLLSLRIDRRFHFTSSNLILYLSIWNVLDRTNYTYNGWDEIGNFEVIYQHFSIAPIFGIEFEF